MKSEKRLLNFDVPPTDGITILSIPLAPSIKRQRKFNKRLHKSNKHSDPLCMEEYYKPKILQQIWTSVIVICIGCGLFFFRGILRTTNGGFGCDVKDAQRRMFAIWRDFSGRFVDALLFFVCSEKGFS